MIFDGTPVLDPRAATDFYDELTVLQPAFVPELPPQSSGPAAALLQMLSRFAGITAQRLNQAPDLNKLAFLDMLGISLIPAHPARAPLVFQPLPTAVDAHIPAGTRAGAQFPGASKPLVFETEAQIAMTSAKLKQVVSLWPDRDGFVEHSNYLAGGRTFTLFDQPTPVEHSFYVSHGTLLAFQGKATVEVRFALSSPGSKPVTFRWEFWDGQTWRSFHDFDATDPTASRDGTHGLTRSGVVKLLADCGNAASTSVANIANYWIRSRLTAPLPPDPSRNFAVASQVSLRTTIDRSLQHGPGGSGCNGVAKLDAAFAGGTTLDLTKNFYPLGKAPGTDAVFYFTSREVFSKPGANVTLCFDRTKTPEEEADALGGKYAVDVAKAEQDLVKMARQIAGNAVDTAATIIDFFAGKVDVTAINNAVNALKAAAGGIKSPGDIPRLKQPLIDVFNSIEAVETGLSINAKDWLSAMQGGGFPAMLNAGKKEFQDVETIVDTLSAITAIGAAGAGGSPPPRLAAPRLAWEYFNGSVWKALLGPSNNDATNLMASGEISFVLPQDLQPFPINGSPVLGMRARLVSGSYNILQLVSWTDPTSGQTNFIPVLQPRPPLLSHIAIGYVYRSAWMAPQQSLSWNDFTIESHTPTPSRGSAPYAPFHPVADALPALYLGFDQPLPNDYLSFFFDLVESEGDGPPLAWEGWSDGEWQTLAVSDDTGALARGGMVAFLGAGSPARPVAKISSASAYFVTAVDALAAAVFSAGDGIVIQPDKAAEFAVIDSINGASIRLVTPLSGTYSSTTGARAALPRFGRPLDWVRARGKTDGLPRESVVNGIYPNAVWARQVQTVNTETLGSSTGQPNHSLFFRQFPVLEGERVQVRELNGAQANVGYPALQAQLLEQGFSKDDIRLVTDPRTSVITEVWVTWRGQPNLYFSGPGDRHYVMDRASGRIVFGDGMNGMLPVPGNSNIMAFLYQAGGGLAGNVNAGAISQLLSGAAAQGVKNPVAAEGGADTEALSTVNRRGPQVLRHRGAALSAADYEALALEASPGVAIVRCLPATGPDLRPAPGRVTLILVPHSLDPQPMPSYELKREVIAYLAERAPAAIEAGRISVIPPSYLPVGVSATIAASQIERAGIVKAAVVAALRNFLHPLSGGPDGRGWPFGRSVYISDVARLLEGLDGVDYVRQLELLLEMIPAGDTVLVPPRKLVAAGQMFIVMEGALNL